MTRLASRLLKGIPIIACVALFGGACTRNYSPLVAQPDPGSHYYVDLLMPASLVDGDVAPDLIAPPDEPTGQVDGGAVEDMLLPANSACGDRDPHCRTSVRGLPSGMMLPLLTDQQPDPNEWDDGLSRDNQSGAIVLSPSIGGASTPGVYRYILPGCDFNGPIRTYWYAIDWTALIPISTELVVLARTGNTLNPDDGSWGAQSSMIDGSMMHADLRKIMLQPFDQNDGYIQLEFRFSTKVRGSTPYLGQIRAAFKCPLVQPQNKIPPVPTGGTGG